MKSTLPTLLSALAALTSAASAASPSPSTGPLIQDATITLLDSASQPLETLYPAADNHPVTATETAAVAFIDNDDYDIAGLCHFVFAPQPGLPYPSTDATIAPNGYSRRLLVIPPTPLHSVTCHGFCVGQYGDCNGLNVIGPQPCCNGFCAANLCRPWNDVKPSSK